MPRDFGGERTFFQISTFSKRSGLVRDESNLATRRASYLVTCTYKHSNPTTMGREGSNHFIEILSSSLRAMFPSCTSYANSKDNDKNV
mmetsp:Transcript_25352/g.69871  ORF Transcript_25352/g.69871 Transcript_25352/m.69871 type:complete len:88 (-) Transcript_25352:3150-3413(-)